ncbi:MAG: HAMP domain-containing protein [Burkholderiales bacterium]|nr:MAG: HAMP domain-containing protein [Burkholderiales bacterium]
MFRRNLNLRLKVGLYLILALAPVAFLLPYLIVEYEKALLQGEIGRQATQSAELIVRSTRFAMLVNEREVAEQIIRDISRQAGIERVRVLNKDGTIVHSKHKDEAGHSVEQEDEPCVRCHETSEPLSRLAQEKRWRIYTDGGGHRLLATMAPIRNESSCSEAECHEHRPTQSVLGVVDVAYSLDEIDETLRSHGLFIFGLSAGIILLVAAGVGLLFQRLIYVPLKDLNTGARKISSGDLEHQLPVRSADEFGRVAQSFNHMSAALKNTMGELRDLVQTLEEKVAERTRELRVAEREIAHGEKLASVGLLASGVAHELNNPLTGVLTFTTLLRKKMPPDSAEAEDLDLVIRETKRCASIIRRLLDFAREKVPTEGFVDLNALIEEVVRFVANPATLQNIEIKTRLAPDLPKVWGDADLIKQVVMNILVNATQAIEGSGNVLVRSRLLAPEAQPQRPDAPAMVEVSIKDTGCGIPEQNLQRIFDPFFTSKQVGKGTGLGLSVSYGIVKAHGGSIKVESAVGEGSTFRVQLPTASPFAEADPGTSHFES